MHAYMCVNDKVRACCRYSACHLLCYFPLFSTAIAWHVCFRKLSSVSVGCVCFDLTLADVWNLWCSVVFVVFACTCVCVCVCAFSAYGCRYALVWMCARHVSDLIRWILTRPRLNPPDVSAVTPPPQPPPSPPPPLQTTAITSAALHSNTVLPPADGALIRAAIMGWL